MTSREKFPWRASVMMLAVALWMSACAALPDDAPVVEQLDEQTGVTIARLGRPVELYRENFREDAAGERFAFLGPFETNNMGKRDLFLLIGLPEEREPSPQPLTLLADGTPLELGEPGPSAEFAALRQSPYRMPAPWVRQYYYRVDATLIARLAQASELRLQATENTRKGARRVEYSADVGKDSRLKAFASR